MVIKKYEQRTTFNQNRAHAILDIIKTVLYDFIK